MNLSVFKTLADVIFRRTDTKIGAAIIVALHILLRLSSPYECLAEEKGTAQAFMVRYPADKQLIRKEMTYLVAEVLDQRIAYAVVKVNDHITPVIDMTTEEYRQYLGNTLKIRLFLVPGSNTIEVVGRDDKGVEVASSKITLFYQETTPKGTMDAPSEFVAGRLHKAEVETFCAKCHKMKVDPVIDLDPVKKYDLFCVPCHEPAMADQKPHGKATWKCLRCHDENGNPKYSTKDAQGAYCGGCHGGDLTTFGSMTSIHPNVAENNCLACHTMHSDKGEALVADPINVICFRCHKTQFAGGHITPGHPLEGKKDTARKGKEFNCISCHDPHSANRRALMRYSPGMTMCQACHVM